jgi:hypothetical protein
MEKKVQPDRRRKPVRKERRIATRLTEDLFNALQQRAYEENKSASVVLTEALIKYLNFKMPPMIEKKTG